MKLSEPQQQAYNLYLAGQTTQREIADIIGVTERTIYNWIRQFSWQRIREAAMAAPSIITEKISRHIISLLDSISAREEGKQFPTMQEAEITRKMVVCMDKFKRYPTMALSMQTVDSLVSFINQSGDFRLADQLQNQADEYFAQSTTGGFKPCEPEYGINPTHVQREVTFAEFCENADGPLLAETEIKPEMENEQEIETESLTGVELEPVSGAFQQHEKTGNPVNTYPQLEELEDTSYVPHLNSPPVGAHDENPESSFIKETRRKPEMENEQEMEAERLVGIELQPVSGTFQQHEKTGNSGSSYPQLDEPENNAYKYAVLPIDCPIDHNDFEEYKHLLRNPHDTDWHLQRFKGEMVNYAWLQYNLFQFYLPADERRFIASEEVYKQEINTPLECYKIKRFFSRKGSLGTGS